MRIFGCSDYNLELKRILTLSINSYKNGLSTLIGHDCKLLYTRFFNFEIYNTSSIRI